MNKDKIARLEQLINTDYGNTAGIVVRKDGETAYEQYFDMAAEDSLHVYSVTKSVVSMLVGIAIDKGLIKSVEQKLLEFFPDYHASDDTVADIAIKDLLTMTAAYKFQDEPYMEYFSSESWVSTALDMLGGQTGEFRYTPIIGPDILSGILVRATGMPVLDFAREHLFAPMGIDVGPSLQLPSQEEHLAFIKARSTRGWVVDPQGVNTAAWGLSLRPADMAKLGQMYLDGGVYGGQRIVSAEWVRESTRVHSRWEAQKLRYGYLWWVLDEDSFAAMGDGGNVIYVNTGKGIVVAIASHFVPNAKDRIRLIQKEIEPVFAG